MIDISNLNYKELIDLEKKIQIEKTKKVQDYFTKYNIHELDKSHELLNLLDSRFCKSEYGYPKEHPKLSEENLDWFNNLSEESKQRYIKDWERPDIEKTVYKRTVSNIIYLCDIAFANYRNAQRKAQGQQPVYQSSISINKEIPWKQCQDYKNMYNEICDILINRMKITDAVEWLRKGDSE